MFSDNKKEVLSIFLLNILLTFLFLISEVLLVFFFLILVTKSRI